MFCSCALFLPFSPAHTKKHPWLVCIFYMYLEHIQHSTVMVRYLKKLYNPVSNMLGKWFSCSLIHRNIYILCFSSNIWCFLNILKAQYYLKSFMSEVKTEIFQRDKYTPFNLELIDVAEITYFSLHCESCLLLSFRRLLCLKPYAWHNSAL